MGEFYSPSLVYVADDGAAAGAAAASSGVAAATAVKLATTHITS